MGDGIPNNLDPQPDDENPLGDIDPMAWLESLAARQGADERELMTSHDIPIEEIDPESAVIDEPGYTPYEMYGSDTQKTEAAQETEQYQETPAQEAAPQDAYPPQEPAPAQPMAMTDDGIPEGVDPLAWLESLAARQGADERELLTQHNIDIAEIDPDSVVIDEPGYTPSETIKARHPQPEETPPAQEVAPQDAYPPQEPAPAQPMAMTDDGIPEGVDPLAWLESLAARQGADERELLTQHNIDIAEIDPDSVVIDEPGYTPSETIKARHPQPEEMPPEPEMPSAPQEDDFAEMFDAELEPEGLQWLGGAPTSGATDFLSELTGDIEPAPDAEPATETPSWLNELAAVNDDTETGMDFLSTLEAEQEQPDAIDATHTQDEIDQSIDGLSDDEIAGMQARGELRPEQELAWLQRQARSMAEARQEEEETFDEASLEPAEAFEIPDWLKEAATVSDEPKDEPPIFLDEMGMPSEPEDMPDWLSEETDKRSTSEIELPELDLEETDGTPPEPVAELPEAYEAPSADNIINLDDYDPSQDDWAEALDEEHERQQSGIAEDPTWFRTAMEKAQKADLEAEAEAASTDWLAEVQEESPLSGDEGLPDWLQEVEDEPEISEIDEWLRVEETGGAPIDEYDTADVEPETEIIPPEELEPESVEAELLQEEEALPPAESESLQRGKTGPLPSWALDADEEAEPAPAVEEAPEPVAPAPPSPVEPAPSPIPERPAPPIPTPHVTVPQEPVPEPAAPALVPAQFEAYRAKLDENPEDHATRLELARAMIESGDVETSIPQYETLVDQMGELDHVSTDLRGFISKNPAHPALRRLLGDVYMRQGYLQEALDAYRGALDNL